MGNNRRNGLVRADESYRMSNLPTLRSNSFEFRGKNGQKIVGYIGSVIKRPVKNSLNIYEHFGLVYGHCQDGVFRIIELNINGVECITLRDFLRGSGSYIIEPNINPSSCDEILTRAHKKAFDMYN